MSDRKTAFWFIALLSILVIVPFLGETVFHTKGEPREAIVAMSIIEHGNWILPVNYGGDIPYKPLFLYWAIAAFSLPFGEVTEFTSRLPSAFSFIAMLLVFFRFVARRKNVQTAVLTSLLLLTSFEVHRAAVACRLDMLQVSFIVISLCLLFRWDERNCKGLPWLAILLMACGTLTKGPVGSIFPCVAIGLYQLLQGRPFFKTFFTLLIIGLFSLVPLGLWFWAAAREGGQAFVDLMMEENWDRFAGTMSYASHYNPMWYNFLTLIWGWVPWTLVLLISLFGLRWRQMRLLPAGSSLADRLKKAWQGFRSLSPWQQFAWVVILFIFIFYCIPKSKRSVYLLPIYPFVAMLLADYLQALVQRGAKALKISAWIFASLCMLLMLTFLAVRLGLVPDSIWGTGRHAAENVAFMRALADATPSFAQWVIVLLPVAAGLCTYWALAKKASARSLLYAVAGCMLCIFVALDGFYQPTVLRVKSDKKLAERFEQYVPDGCFYTYTDRMIRFYCANFYLKDRLRDFGREQPQEGYVALSVADKDCFLQYCDGRYELEEVEHTSYRSCDLRAEILIYKFKRKP